MTNIFFDTCSYNVCLTVSLSQQQTGKLRRLIERVRAFSASCCWGGRPLGSVVLWEKHKAALERILQIASSITITQVKKCVFRMKWNELSYGLCPHFFLILAGWETATAMVRFTRRMPSRSSPSIKWSTRYWSIFRGLRTSSYSCARTKNLAGTCSVPFHAPANSFYKTT